MSIDKYQKFLKNKHKFDPKPILSDQYDKFKLHTQKFLKAVKSDDNKELKRVIKPFMNDLLVYLSRNDIMLSDLIKGQYNP
jgi:hypothetical protein